MLTYLQDQGPSGRQKFRCPAIEVGREVRRAGGRAGGAVGPAVGRAIGHALGRAVEWSISDQVDHHIGRASDDISPFDAVMSAK